MDTSIALNPSRHQMRRDDPVYVPTPAAAALEIVIEDACLAFAAASEAQTSSPGSCQRRTVPLHEYVRQSDPTRGILPSP